MTLHASSESIADAINSLDKKRKNNDQEPFTEEATAAAATAAGLTPAQPPTTDAVAMVATQNADARLATRLRIKKRKNEHGEAAAHKASTAGPAPAHAQPPVPSCTYPPASYATAVTPIPNEGARPNKKRREPKASVPLFVPPELTLAESSSAEMDGLVWARSGNFASWPAHVQMPSELQMNTMNLKPRPSHVREGICGYLWQA